ncbi:hypothetical protein ACH41E_01960 [Streptomyces sp. NPDC020412]|uniref:hypothetical protein n=1 Tax=Streptomyces sp. NPDC020412 TaxID=3365073 RepID=UPI0037BDD4D8
MSAGRSRTGRSGRAPVVPVNGAPRSCNGLYRRIGYRPVADFTMYDFTTCDSTTEPEPEPEPEPESKPESA